MAPIGASIKNIESTGAAARRPLLHANANANAITRRTSLLLKDDLSLEEWVRIGRHLDRALDSSTWWLGDWLVYGRARFPERYRQVVEATAFDYQTLRNYAWVANRVNPLRRRPALSFQHHAEVAALSGAQQEEWLSRAEQNRWSRNRLRAEIRSRQPAADVAGGGVLRLRLADHQLRRWQDAAAQAGQDLAQWMTQNLDDALPGGD